MDWGMMSPNFFYRFLYILTIFFSILSGKSFNQFTKSISTSTTLDSIKAALFDPKGLELGVVWRYNYEDEEWEGTGTLLLLNHDYLKLTLPFQVILIKKSTIMSYYPETDQVIIDYFDRNDHSNFFSILLSDYSEFSITSEHIPANSDKRIVLESNSLIGFDRIEMILSQDSWIPRVIIGQAGTDIKIMVTVESVSSIKNPDDLINDRLTGTEIIDLRE